MCEEKAKTEVLRHENWIVKCYNNMLTTVFCLNFNQDFFKTLNSDEYMGINEMCEFNSETIMETNNQFFRDKKAYILTPKGQNRYNEELGNYLTNSFELLGDIVNNKLKEK